MSVGRRRKKSVGRLTGNTGSEGRVIKEGRDKKLKKKKKKKTEGWKAENKEEMDVGRSGTVRRG